MLYPFSSPIGKEDTFRGIIDLVEMNADIYYDQLGKDVRVEPIPEDMAIWPRNTARSCWTPFHVR